MMELNDKHKHFILCALCALVMSSGIALLVWSSLIVCHCEEMMPHLLAPIWLGGFTSALALGVGKEYGDECAENNNWDWQDIAADIVGAIIGASFVCLIIKLILVC